MEEFIRIKRWLWFILPKVNRIVKYILEEKAQNSGVFGKKRRITTSYLKII